MDLSHRLVEKGFVMHLHVPKRINGIYYNPSKLHKLVVENED
jgi:hypothetical protein